MQIGIFGGAFDPFHNEHRHLIECAKRELCLDKIIIVPSYLPPHKNCEITPYEIRRRMVEAGTADLDYIIIDDIEYERGTVNPTSVVLPLLKAKYPCEKLYFLMGGDSAVNFKTWIAPDIIAKCAVLAFCERSGCGDIRDDVKDIERLFNAETRILSYVGEWVSSSQIKAAQEIGLELTDVPQKVADIIKGNNLYRRFENTVSELKSDIPQRTFEHCARVAIFAAGYGGVLKLKYEDVFLSALLHDCAKHIKTEIDGVPLPVVHQFTGAERARDVYGITEENILDAIRYHTTGKPEMTSLGKLIYSADMLEWGRNFDGVDTLREIMESDFESGFRVCVKASLNHIIKQNNPIHPLTEECARYYNINTENE